MFVLGIIVGGLLLAFHAAILTLVIFLTLFYFIDILFMVYMAFMAFFKSPEIKISSTDIEEYKNYDWPVYTIFCPLYKEVSVLKQFIKAMTNLDYPSQKLQVILLLEEDDIDTINQIKKMSLPKYFQILVNPHSMPKTKPKALNYGLHHAKGQYVVIYDAEDIPDPLQLKKTVIAFNKKVKKNVVCIQAKLNYYNPHQNLLTKLFTLEYSLWFNLTLPGLQAINAPIPLGGTSNHFRLKDIIKLQGWDPFNVTEDADLGMRIAKSKSKTAIINSITLEEANSDLKNWFKQRSRWIKGYIQTYFVHSRAYINASSWDMRERLLFQIFIGTKTLSLIINPFMWILTIAYFALHMYTAPFIESLFPGAIFYIGSLTLFLGNTLYIYCYMLGASKREQWNIIYYALLCPLYWLAISMAAYLALFEFIKRPHHWYKTQHGLHMKNQSNIAFANIK
jgi:cellulose synthase/poly-beta-1,6-N-acetylglucosamine synthase-like glycosyltransferase